MPCLAASTYPCTIFKAQIIFDIATARTGHAGREVPVYYDQPAASLIALMLQDTDKLCKAKVVYLPAPELLHAFKTKILYTDHGIL